MTRPGAVFKANFPVHLRTLEHLPTFARYDSLLELTSTQRLKYSQELLERYNASDLRGDLKSENTGGLTDSRTLTDLLLVRFVTCV